MKTRRALHIIVGILSLLVLICMLGAAACAGLAMWKPSQFELFNSYYQRLTYGVNQIAPKVHLAELSFLVPLLAFGLPALLLLIAVCLLFSRNKGKMGKYNAGCVLALIGMAILSIFTVVFASELVIKFDAVATTAISLAWLVRLVAIGALVLFVLFIGLALGLKGKKAEPVTESAEPIDTPVEREQQPVATVEQRPFNDYVPVNTSVADVTNSIYGNSDEIDPETMAILARARKLVDAGALTYEEYQKLVKYYTNKK